MLLINSRTTDSRGAAKSAELLLLCKPRPAACALLRVLSLFAASFICVQAQWMNPRTSASEYAAHAELQNASIGAGNLGHNMSTAKGAITVPDYLVIEIALYSKTVPVQLKAGNFMLRLNGKKALLMAQAPAMVIASLKYPDWETRPALIGMAGVGDGMITVGRPTHTGRFPGDPTTPPSNPVPRAPTEASSVQKEQPESPDDLINHHALPEGEVRPPLSGYLFFPFHGKLKSLKKVELLYEGPLGAATLLLP
jgi:hypothetical protein